MKDLKETIFEHCHAAADQAIRDPSDRQMRREGGNREQEAKYSALLGVITAAGLEDEYRKYCSRQSTRCPSRPA